MRRLSIFLINVLLISLFVVGYVASEEGTSKGIRYPVPCYEGEELKKIKEWEKEWVGKRVDSANLGQVKQFLPEGLVKIMMEPKNWGTDELWFEVVPYRTCEVTKGFIEATKKYAPLSKLDANGFLIGSDKGLLAGLPFPNPKTGSEMAWNFDSITMCDSHFNTSDAGWVDAKTGSDRNPIHSQRWHYYAGRTDVPPFPNLPNNNTQIRRASLSESFAPPDHKGYLSLEYKYLDPKKDNDQYSWVASIRRVQRKDVSKRWENWGPNDMCLDDDFGWCGHISKNTYRYLEQGEMLAARHQNLEQLQRKKGQPFFHGQQRERIKIYIIEAINKEPKYVYSKELWYLDPETWLFLYKEMWDREGRLWRFSDFHNQEVTGWGGQKLSFVVGDNYVDLIKFHGTPNKRFKYTMGIQYTNDIFTPTALQKGY